MNKQYTKEELVGKRFIVKSSGEYYDILYPSGNDIYYKNVRPEFSSTYQNIGVFNQQLNNGKWELIEESMKDKYTIGTEVEYIADGDRYTIKDYRAQGNGVLFIDGEWESYKNLEEYYKIITPMKYKTKAGIEYGVGTRFENVKKGENSGVFTIDEIDSQYNTIKYTRLDMGTHYSVSITEFNNNLQTNWWIISNIQEIIGYETVVDLPGIPKGTVLKVDGGVATIVGNLGEVKYKTFVLSDTKFFKPIYKSKETELKFSKYTATLSKEHGLVFTDGEKLRYAQLVMLLSAISVVQKDSVKSLGTYQSFRVSLDTIVTGVQVGCKSFNMSDVDIITRAVKELD